MVETRRPPLLFIVGNKTDAFGVRSYIDQLKIDFHCIIYFTSHRFYSESSSTFSDCEVIHFNFPAPTFLLLEWAQKQARHRVGRKHWLTESIKQRIALQQKKHRRSAFRRWCRRTVQKLRNAVIVSPSDRQMGEGAVLILEAKRRKLPFVTLLVAAPADEAYLLTSKTGAAKHNSTALVKAYFPLHTRQIGSDEVAFFNDRHYQAFLENLTRREAKSPLLKKTNPWAMGEMWADMIIVPSDHIAQMLRGEGTRPEKIQVLGSLALDNLARAKEAAADTRCPINVGPSRKLVGWAVHHHFEQNRCSLETSLSIAANVAQTLASVDFQVRCSLHPKMVPERYSGLLQRFNIQIEFEKFEHWLPGVDLAVISAFSSTVYWALACGIPTVLYDFLGRDPHPIGSLAGVRFVRNAADMHDALSVAKDGGSEWQAWAGEAQQNCSLYGRLDGKSTERIRAQLRLLARAQ